MVKYMYTSAVNMVSTYGHWWDNLGLGWEILLSNSGIVTDKMIMIPVWREVIIGHAIIAHWHVGVIWVLWLSLGGGHKHVSPCEPGNITRPITDHGIPLYASMSMGLLQ
jgi:hypothetical protein